MLHDLEHIHLQGLPLESVEYRNDHESMDKAAFRIVFIATLKRPVARMSGGLLQYMDNTLAGINFESVGVYAFLGQNDCPLKARNVHGFDRVCGVSNKFECNCEKDSLLKPSNCCDSRGEGWECDFASEIYKIIIIIIINSVIAMFTYKSKKNMLSSSCFNVFLTTPCSVMRKVVCMLVTLMTTIISECSQIFMVRNFHSFHGLEAIHNYFNIVKI
jgi:hypothetical protein